MRSSFKPRALIHEFGAVVQTGTEGCHIINSHLPLEEREREREREEWSVLRAVSRLVCEMVPLSFFEVPFQPRFLLQELIFQSSKVDSFGFVDLFGWPSVRWLDIPGFTQHAGRRDMVETEESIASFGLWLPGDSGLPHGIDSRH